MVSISRVHPPNSVTLDLVLSSNQEDTRGARDAGVDICRNVCWVDN